MVSVAPAAGWRVCSAAAWDLGEPLTMATRKLAQRGRAVVLDSAGLRVALAQQIHRNFGAAHHPIARLLRQSLDARKVDANQAAAPLLDLAGDEHGLDMPWVHQIDHRARR